MKNKQVSSALLEIFNKNISIEDRYTDNEIQIAFIQGSYFIKSKRTKEIYDIFFKHWTPDDEKEFCSYFGIKKSAVKGVYLTSPLREDKVIGKIWDKRYKITKHLYSEFKQEKILPRSYSKYVEIDNFGTYELTPCIAYEMAIRNKDVQRMHERLKLVSTMIADEEYSFKRYLAPKDFKTEKEYLDYKSLIMLKHRNYKNHIKEDYKKFIDEHINKCTELTINHLNTLKEKLENELINVYLIYPEGYQRNIPNASPVICEEVNSNKTLETVYYDKNEEEKENKDKDKENKNINIYERIVHDEFIEIQGFYSNSEKYFINNIIPNFKRQVNDQEQITIPINLSLPLNEIKEYIEIVQRKAKIKSQLEFLEEELENASNLNNMNAINSKGKQVHLDALKGKQQQYNLSNMLYIYDMVIDGFEEGVITESILDHYYDLLKEKKIDLTYKLGDSRTFEQYYKIAEAYIDGRYKELITGKIEKE